MTSASSARVSSPCIPETHEHAPAAVLALEGRAANKGEVDLTDFDHQGGADPVEAKEKLAHGSSARYYESHVRGQDGQARPRGVNRALGQVPHQVG